MTPDDIFTMGKITLRWNLHCVLLPNLVVASSWLTALVFLGLLVLQKEAVHNTCKTRQPHAKVPRPAAPFACCTCIKNLKFDTYTHKKKTHSPHLNPASRLGQPTTIDRPLLASVGIFFTQ